MNDDFMTKKLITLVSYKVDDERGERYFVGRPFESDMANKRCKLKQGCIIHAEQLIQYKDRDEGIRELYQRAKKEYIVPVNLEHAEPAHTINFLLDE